MLEYRCCRAVLGNLSPVSVFARATLGHTYPHLGAHPPASEDAQLVPSCSPPSPPSPPSPNWICLGPTDRLARGGLQPHRPDLCHAAWQRPLLDRAGGARPEPRLSLARTSSPAPTPRLERRLRVYPGAHRDLRADRPVHRGELQGGELDPSRQDQGRGKLDRSNSHALPVKDVYLYPLHRDYLHILVSPASDLSVAGQHRVNTEHM